MTDKDRELGVSKQETELLGRDSATKDRLLLKDGTSIDLSDFSEEEATELRMMHAKGALSTIERAKNIAVDAHALDDKLTTMSERTAQLSEQGTAVTITNEHKDQLGKTEIVMGNTQAAQKGLTQASHRSDLAIRLGFGAFLVVVVAIVIVKVFQQ
jgi:hypothetical protein